MTFVLTNDDGIDAPGIQALTRAVTLLNHSMTIVAPQEHLSGCGHQVTTTEPIRVQERADTISASPSTRAYAIAGTPADCVRIAVSHLCPTIQWVLSGINLGGNLGSDVYISGTVAAVREAALHRIPGIAISHYRQGKRPIDWELAIRLTTRVLNDLLARPLPLGSYWNVNLPHLQPDDPDPEIIFCLPCTQPLPALYRVEGDRFSYIGNYAQRSRDANRDVEICFSGKISVTQLHIE